MKKVKFTLMTMVMLFVFVFNTKAQDVHPSNATYPTYRMEIRNDSLLTDKIYEFDIFIKCNSTVDLKLSLIQYGFLFNLAVINGGAIQTPTVTGGDLPLYEGGAWSIATNATNGNIKKGLNSAPGTGPATIITFAEGWKKAFRVRITNTVPFGQTKPNLSYLLTNTSGFTKTSLSAYVGVTNTSITTATPNATIQAWHINSNLNNPTLNKPILPKTIVGAGSTITVPTSESDLVYYCVKQGATADLNDTLTLNGTGVDLAFTGLTPGTYKVTAHRPATYMYLQLSGSFVVSNTPTAFNVSGGGSYCAGSTANGTVTLSGSEVAFSYQLYKDAVAEGTPVVGTGAALVWNNLVAGNYTVKATDAATTAMTGNVTVTENPLAATPIVSVVNNCDGTSTLTIDNAISGANFVWNGGLSGNPLITGQGTYTVTQTPVGGCTSLPSADAIAAPKTTPDAPIASVMDNCGNSEFSISNLLAGATVTWYDGVNLVHTGELYTVNNNVTLTAKQEKNGCTSLASNLVTSAPTPSVPVSVSIVADASNVCAGTTVTFTATPVNGGTPSYQWKVNGFDAGVPSSSTFASNLFANTDVVTCVLTSDLGCTTGNPATSNAIALTVNSIPVQPEVTVNNTCGNSAFTITNGEAGAIFNWTPAVADLNNVAAGTYTLTQTVGTCTSIASANVVAAPLTVPVQPVVTVNNTCNNSAFTITNGEAGAIFNWTPAVADLNNVAAGTYTLTQTVGTCTSIASANVVAAPLTVPVQPVVTVNNTCGNSAFTITNGEAGAIFNWTPAVADLNNVAAGTYTLTQTVGTCTSIASANVVAAPLTVPVQPIVTVNNTCNNSAFTITNGEVGATFNWTPAVANLNNVAAGTYTLTQTVGTCTSIASANVVAAPLTVPVQPIVTVNNTCNNSAFTITNGEVGATFNWTPAVANLNNVAAGTYTVTQSLGNCNSIASANVVAAPLEVPAQPIVTVNNTCGNSAFTITNGAVGATFNWAPAVANLNNVAAGTYTVTQSLGNCNSIASANVVAAPLEVPAQPIVTVNNTCGNSAFTITNGAVGATFNWAPAVANLNNVAAGTYTVTQSLGNCNSIASANVVAAPIAPTTQIVTIAANQPNPVNQYIPVTYTANLNHAPISGQTFMWYVNGIQQVNFTGSTFVLSLPVSGDQITCTANAIDCYLAGSSNVYTQNVSVVILTTTWTGAANNHLWADAANWDLAVPTVGHDAIIPVMPASNYPEISTPAVCHNLTLMSNATGTAQLKVNNTLTIGGKVYANQYLSAGQWHFVSSPINNSTAYAYSNANPNNASQNLFLQTYNEAWVAPPFDPSASPWVDVTNGPAEIMSAGKGYEAWSANNHIITMEGTQLNNANVVAPVTYTGGASFPGFNLIGNPYPSAINILSFPTWGNNMDASMWIWDGSQYFPTNGVIGAFDKVAACQSFMVKANAGASFTIPAAARTFGGTFYKSTVADVLKLKVTGNNYSDVAYVNFNSNATANYDGQFDVEKIFGIDAAPQFYSTITNKNLSINTLPSLTSPVVVPMSLNVGANTTYTITASEMNSFANGTTITLEDTKTNTFTNLMQQAVYTFTASPADNANRFKVHFGVNGINENGNGNISIYSNSNVIYVNNNSNEVVKEIVVMNVLGQEILNKKAANTTVNTITMDVASAYYVVKVVTSNKVYTEKVYVR